MMLYRTFNCLYKLILYGFVLSSLEPSDDLNDLNFFNQKKKKKKPKKVFDNDVEEGLKVSRSPFSCPNHMHTLVAHHP